jgi:hypothetical protein
MMSPVAESVMPGAEEALADGAAEIEAVAAAAAVGTCHTVRFVLFLSAKATLPTPTAAITARTIVTVRIGRPKRP